MQTDKRFDFFLSRRGSVASIAREVADVLTERGYKVVVQDYDDGFRIGSDFVEAMHEAIKNARDLIVLFTLDYESSPYTRKEFTSFEANRLQSAEERRLIILRCEDAPPLGLLAGNVYQDLVGINDPQERRRRIVAAAEGHSLAQPPPPRPFVGVPPRIASFTGRAAELDRLDAILMGGEPAAITQMRIDRAAVQGMGGVGKTSLAAEYAHLFRELYAGVWWCPAESRAGLLTALSGLAVLLGAAAADEANFETAAKAGLRRLAEQRSTWLLVYDNVTSPDEIADLLPAHGARVLITSRFPDWSGWAEEVALDVLPSEVAGAFLESRARRSDAAGAAALAATLGHLPLALDHAAAYCRRTQLPFITYAAKAEQLIASAPRGAAYPRSISATFDLSIEAAVAECSSVEGLIAFLAQCSPERIPMSLVEGAIEDEVERLHALSALAEISLLKHDAFEDGTPAVTVHRLVQAVARHHSRKKGADADASAHLMAVLWQVYPDDGFQNSESWSRCAGLTPHLLAVMDRTESNRSMCSIQRSYLLTRAAHYFHGRASYEQAAPLYEGALQNIEKVLGPSHPLTAYALNNLAYFLKNKGDFVQARKLCERALAICEQTIGPEHIDTATSLDNLADSLVKDGDFLGAEPLCRRALAISEKALGPNHPDTALHLNNLASLLHQKGDLREALSLYERSLALCEIAHGHEHPITARAIDNLAKMLHGQGEYERAQVLYERAVAIAEAVLGPEHPDTGMHLNNLALVLWQQGKLCDAMAIYQRVLEICKKTLGPDHANTQLVLQNKIRLSLALQNR